MAHDLGTTGDKATLFSEAGNLVASSFFGYETFYPGPGMVEQDPEAWWTSFCRATSDLVSKSGISAEDLSAVSISGQMMAVVPVDKSGGLLRRAIIWADSRSSEQVKALLSTFSESEIYRITGSRLSPTYQGLKIAWLRMNEPDVYEGTYKFLQAKDYINLRLTGKFATDFSDAVMTSLFDISKLSWSPEMISALKVDNSKLPEALPSITDLGKIKSDVARDLGLSESCRVILGAGDGCSAAVGAGAVEVGDTYLYLGSSSWISTITKEPLLDRQMRVFTGAHAIEGHYFPSGTMQAGGSSYSWIKDMLYGDNFLYRNEQDVYSYLDRVLLDSPSHGEPIIYLPYLLGERSPIWDSNARGTFIGLSASHKKLDMVRAVIEGVSMNLKWILDTLEESLPITSIRVIGGGIKSNIWKKVLANVLGKTLTVPENVDEATSIGAAIIAGVGSGLFNFSAVRRFIEDVDRIEPIRDEQERYLKLYSLFKESYCSLRKTYEGLAGIRRG